MKYNFVKTSDEKCAEFLRKAGYPELNKEGNKFVFINSPLNAIPFTPGDDKVEFTNTLYT